MVKNDKGVSELIGVLVIIGIIAGAVGIFTVFLISQPPPAKLPATDFSITIDKPTEDNPYLHITNTRGNSFKIIRESDIDPDFRVMVNGKKQTILRADDPSEPGENQLKIIKSQTGSDSSFNKYYSVGDSLVGPLIATGTEKPSVQFISKLNDGTERLLWETNPVSSAASDVDFNAQPIEVCIGESVQFFGISTINPDTWSWNFGDTPTPSTGQNPPHAYTAAGKYTVTLTATNSAKGASKTMTKQAYITVKNIIPEFSGSPLKGVGPFTTNFIDHSQCLDSTANFMWTFGDGISADNDTLQSPGHIYQPVATTKHYDVDLKVSKIVNGILASDNITKVRYVTVCPDLSPDFSMSPSSVYANDPITFTGNAIGDPIKWDWNFGDGSGNKTGLTTTYSYASPGTYTIILTEYNECIPKSISKPITILARPVKENVYADPSWDTPKSTDPYLVQFHSPVASCGKESCDYNIVKWEWNFEDGTPNQTTREPLHEFPAGYNPSGKYVTLTVWNNDPVNSTDTARRLMTFDCPSLIPDFTATVTNDNPLTVSFTENSVPQEKIKKWRWFFGDGSEPYESSNSTTRVPPPHVYADPIPKPYTIVLQVLNACGNGFVGTTVAGKETPASISGHLFDDKNMNQVQDSGEVDLKGWKVDLEQRIGSAWEYKDTNKTDDYGNYKFDFNTVTGVYRIHEYFPSEQTWKPTYSYRSTADITTGPLSISSQRSYTEANFGNVQYKTSSIVIPGSFTRVDGSRSDIFYICPGISYDARYWEYSTSRDPTIVTIYLNPRDDKYGTFPLNSYSAWGDSSYEIRPREYVTYLKGDDGAYYLKRWEWPVKTTYAYGVNFTVPDNTKITADKLRLIYVWDSNIYFKFDKPADGITIPYTDSYGVEVHYQGPYEDTDECYLVSPVNTRLRYNSNVAEYRGIIDVTPYEGQQVTFQARMKLNKGWWITEYRYVTITAKIGVELTPVITDVTSDPGITKPKIKGITTVKGKVTGQYTDPNQVFLLINNQTSVRMDKVSKTGKVTTFTAQFDAEKYAGKTFPLVIVANSVNGTTNSSVPYPVSAQSKNALKANFTADPWGGPSPLEVGFTDTSEGGPNSWSWDFKDGNTSAEQNPIHQYSAPKKCMVTLTVKNSTSTDSISKLVNIEGLWHKVELTTNRNSSLQSGGEIRWITMSDGSSLQIDNTTYPLMMNDSVRLVLRSDITNADTRNNQIEMGGGITLCNLSNVSLYKNSNLIATGNCTGINLPAFSNFHSLLQITSIPTPEDLSKYVLFRWDDLDQVVGKSKTLIIKNLSPDLNSTMTLNVSSGYATFVGWASDYSIG